tara:strand:+ start:170 stop:868 length:699 start_codon:yes stop_codon:yes gene_type:complete
MNINSLVKNKFIVAIPVALLLFGCLYKFNEFKNINKEDTSEEGKDNNEDKKDIKYYLKALIICYLLGIVFVILIKKGYNYYINGTKTNNTISNVEPPISNIVPSLQKQEATFNKEEAIIKRENELKNDINDLNVDIDTSNLESIEIPSIPLKQDNTSSPLQQSNTMKLLSIKENKIENKIEKPKEQEVPIKDNSLETKRKMLLEKRNNLLALKTQQKKTKKIEQFQTGTPNF